MRLDYKEAIERFSYLPRALKLIWAASRVWTILWFIILFVQGLLPAAMVYLTKVLVDSVAAVIGVGATWEAAEILFVPGVLMVIVLLLSQSLGSINRYISTAQAELVQDYMKEMIHAQAMRVDYAYYESSEYYNRLNQASSEAGSRSLALLGNLGTLLESGVTFISIAAILIPYGIWIPLALVFSAAPALFVVLKHQLKQHDWWKRTTSDRRKVQYYDMMLTYDFPAAEVRIFDLGSHFKNLYQDTRRRLRNDRLSLIRDESVATLAAGLSALFVTGGVMAWLIWRSMQGLATIGDLAMFYQAFNQAQGLMRSLLNGMGQMYTNSLFLQHLFEFLSFKSFMEDPPQPKPAPSRLEHGVEYRDVTFSYPDSGQKALEKFNLFIPAGKRVAIVGANGAGKSTIIKLLCRLYDPQEGQIFVDGVNLKEYALKDVRGMVTVLFQFPMRYQQSAEDNIRMGDLNNGTDPGAVEKAARGAMIHDMIQKLPRGYKTQLGKWFDSGVELSGGQWQRVTLARAFYRQAPIVILDEPTSMMDSWAENAWLERFDELVEDKTVVMVTHRFTTAMRADIIHVMDEGDLIESGTHEDLLARDGHYAQSWKTQMRHGFNSVESENPIPSQLDD